MSCPSHSPWLDHSNYTWRRVEITKPLFMQFVHPPFTSPLLIPNIVLRTLFSNTLSLCSSHPSRWRSVPSACPQNSTCTGQRGNLHSSETPTRAPRFTSLNCWSWTFRMLRGAEARQDCCLHRQSTSALLALTQSPNWLSFYTCHIASSSALFMWRLGSIDGAALLKINKWMNAVGQVLGRYGRYLAPALIGRKED
jgi:hypothetical protein